MSEKSTGQASQRKPSSNKNIKKLCTISMVCNLTSSWQQWVTENEKKQADEPSGWAPSSLRGPQEQRRKTWVPKKLPPLQSKPTLDGCAEPPTSTPKESSKNKEVVTSDEAPPLSGINTEQVVKSVISSAEKSSGIGLLTEELKNDSLPSDEEIDRLLEKTSSPTRQRKCSNTVSSLTTSCKQVESEQECVKEEGGPADGHSSGEDKDNRDAGKECVDVKDAPTDSSAKSDEENESDGGPVRIKRPQMSIINTEQVVKSVISSAPEKSSGIGLLTEELKNDSLPSDEEIDRLLEKTSSPTRQRKCSNTVSSLTTSCKQVESEQECVKQEGGPADGHSSGEDKDNRDAGKEFVDVKDAPTDSSAKSDEENESDGGPVRIKRPQMSIHKNEAEDANKINILSKNYSAVGNLKSRWQNWAVQHTVNQKLNPFSEYFDYDYSMSLRLQKGQDGYGRPKEGSKTAERAKRAERYIHREIDDMCYVIRTMADPDPDGKTRVTFGQLFDRYVRISDKVVGILMRARKHGKVAFEGEMLWQGQDDGVIITLLV
ncbi:actin binding Rho activating protein b [Cololabis saira]|uniref:actin binding Rho activating protein b n=1 Tax=Cololabis saira TaxID=129043 RepID=UPI002AD3B38F|nr:actin binding Rho activating protein b [Cololabis saira]